jgi:ubiquinone/menaquinone biosynthesis C-methylase UbiE
VLYRGNENNIKKNNKQGFYSWDQHSFSQDRVKKLAKELAEHLSTDKKLRVLDIGSGTGDFLFRLSQQWPKHEYYGCDVAPSVIAQNKKNKKKIHWSVQDMNSRTSYKNSFFDIIIAGEVIEHFSDTDSFLREMHRVLKSKGLLFLTTPNLASWLDRLTLLFGLQPFSTEVSNVSRTFGRESFYKWLGLPDESESAGHLRCFTKGALNSVLQHFRLEPVKDIPCHVHNILPNRLITAILPSMSQNIFVIAQKVV